MGAGSRRLVWLYRDVRASSYVIIILMAYWIGTIPGHREILETLVATRSGELWQDRVSRKTRRYSLIIKSSLSLGPQFIAQ
ncbi:hypothetical protein BDW72DRAFT_180882 [Aspergillus terricola var. indicus]